MCESVLWFSQLDTHEPRGLGGREETGRKLPCRKTLAGWISGTSRTLEQFTKRAPCTGIEQFYSAVQIWGQLYRQQL